MSAKFVTIDRETPLLFSEDLRKWLPENHIVHLIIEVVRQLDIRSFKVSGSEQYPPEMMLALLIYLIYCYVTKRMSSRVIEEATYNDVAARYICGNREAFREAFTKILILAQEMGGGGLKRVGSISVDGTKIHANASKHSAVSYTRAVEMIEEAEGEVEELIGKAEAANSVPLKEGLEIPEEIKRREERKGALESAKRVMEERYAEAQREMKKDGDAGGRGAKGGNHKQKLKSTVDRADTDVYTPETVCGRYEVLQRGSGRGRRGSVRGRKYTAR
jgi:transposase